MTLDLAAGPFAKQFVTDQIRLQVEALQGIQGAPADVAAAAGQAEKCGDYLLALTWTKVLGGRTFAQARAEVVQFTENVGTILRQSPLFTVPVVDEQHLLEALERDRLGAIEQGHYIEALIYQGLITYGRRKQVSQGETGTGME